MSRSQPEDSIGRDLRKLLWVVVVAALFIAFAGPVSNFVGNFWAARFKESLPDLPSPPTAPDTRSPESRSTTVVLVDAPPTFDFECPVAGEGWRATVVATQFLQDPVGYYTWFRVGGEGLWVYLGLFQSGLEGPAINGIAPGVQVELRYDREALIDPDTSEGYAPFTTGADC